MTPKEQIEFVTELAETVAESIVKQIGDGKIPEEWDGHELRCLLRDRFALVVFGQMENKRSKRYKDYQNTVMVENLL